MPVLRNHAVRCSFLFLPVAAALTAIPNGRAAADVEIDSLELMAADAKLIVRATVEDVATEPSEWHNQVWATITVKVHETLKGKHQPQITFVVNKDIDDELDKWTRSRQELLLFLADSRVKDHPRYKRHPFALRRGWWGKSCIALTEMERGKLFTLDVKVLLEPEEILRQTKAFVAMYADAGQLRRHRFHWPGVAPVESAYPGEAFLFITVPVDRRLEERARQWVKSDDLYLRAEGAKALVYFNSDANTALVKPLIEDPAFRMGEVLEEDGFHVKAQARFYDVRKAAYNTLKQWGVEVAKPVFVEEVPFGSWREEDDETELAAQPELNLARAASFARFSRDGKCLLTASGNLAQLWDVETGKELRRFQGHLEEIRTMAFSPDGKTVLTGGGRYSTMGIVPKDTTARLWDVATGQEIRRFDGHGAAVSLVAFNRDGERMLTLAGGTVTVWETETGQERCHFDVRHAVRHGPSYPDSVRPVAFSPDGRTILGVRRMRARHYVQLWDAETGRELHRTGTHASFICTAVFSPDGKRILTTSSDRTARIWDAETGRQIQEFIGHRDGVESAVFSSNGQRVFTASTDGTVRAWDTETGKEIRRYRHQGPVEYALLAADDQRLLVRWQRMLAPWDTLGYANRPWASLWDVESGREIKQIRHRVFTISPDGKRILIAARSTTLCDAATGQVIRQYAPPRTPPAPAKGGAEPGTRPGEEGIGDCRLMIDDCRLMIDNLCGRTGRPRISISER